MSSKGYSDVGVNAAVTNRKAAQSRRQDAAAPLMETLEDRIAFSINYAIAPGGTLDIAPLSSIIPAAPAGMDRMEVLYNNTPGVAHGHIYRVSGLTPYVWGSDGAIMFKPGAGNNRIYGGEGFEYVNDGTGDGTSESIPVKFRNGFGDVTKTDTIVISISSAVQPPKIDQQPGPLVMVTSGSKGSMNVVASGPGPLSYQWYSGISPNIANPIAGATSPSYTTPTLGGSQQLFYWVKVSNASGSTNSQTVTVQVNTATTVATSSVSLPFKTTDRTINLNATVSPSLSTGVVNFSAMAIGASKTSNTVVNGVAPVTALTVPGGSAAGQYTLTAHYYGPAGVADSYDNKTITITKAGTTTAGVNTTFFAAGGVQSVPLTANITSTAGIVAEGTVTFTLMNGAVQIGQPVTSGTVSNGTATANFSLPADTRAGGYTIKTVYNPGPDYTGSQDGTHVLTVKPSVTNTIATSIPANATSFTINGFGFDSVNIANNTLTLPVGVTGSVTAATPNQITVSNVTGLLAGALNMQVLVAGVASLQAPVGTVIPVVTQASTYLKPNAMLLVINGFGFSTTAANNVVAFTPGAVGFVSSSTKTQINYVFTQPLQNGPLSAVVTTNNASSGAPVQVAIVDGLAPTAANGRINLDGQALGTVSIDLSEQIAPALLLSKFKVDGIGNPAVKINPTGVVQDPVTHTATFSFAAPFAVRNYKGTLSAAGLTDANGNAMAADCKFNFFYLPGDADQDRLVGPTDFNLYATHFGQAGQTWATGDFTGDGVTGPDDFNLLASNFGTSLPSPPAPLMAETPAPNQPADALAPLAGAAMKVKARYSFSSQLLK